LSVVAALSLVLRARAWSEWSFSFLGHVLADVALLLATEAAAQFQRLIKEFLDVPAG
jgi:hypothetical protein